MKHLLRAALAAALFTACSGAGAEPQNFLRDAAIGGMAEVDLGQLAVEHAAAPDVKAFGQRMVTDHTKANGDLKQLAGRKNVALPDKLDDDHRALRDRLSALSGTEFDIAYMNAMTKDHQEDVDAFQKATHSPDAEVAAFASRTLPTLQEHLKEARRVGTELNQRSEHTGNVMPAKAQ